MQIKGRFSRLSVYAIGEHHLTEEELAQSKFDFDLADVLYIRLDPLEAKLQQLQDRRILDNQYLFSVSPIARRWYELMAANSIKQGSDAATPARESLALSVITASHHDLISRLIVSFRINPLKAYHLVITRKEAVSAQLEAWPFRQARPRNLAGWMIQAIENNYDLPPSYLEHKNKRQDRQTRQLAHDRIRSCPFCDEKGFRYVHSAEYPNGAMRQCTHKPSIEATISPDAQNSTQSDQKTANEENNQ